jgi:hypothetical protein
MVAQDGPFLGQSHPTLMPPSEIRLEQRASEVLLRERVADRFIPLSSPDDA